MPLTVTIKPNSKKGPLVVRQEDGNFLVYVREPAIDGRANQALIEIMADHLYISKSRIKIVRGLASRHKIIEVE